MMRALRRSVLLGALIVASARGIAYEIKEFPLPAGSYPNVIILGPDGNFWFTEYGTDSIGVITPTGTITHHFLSGCAPVGLTLAADGFVWFTCTAPTSFNTPVERTRTLASYHLYGPVGATGPIVSTPDGKIAYATTANSVQFLDYAGGDAGSVLSRSTAITGLAAGGDGWVWAALPFDAAACALKSGGSTSCTSYDSSTHAPAAVTWSQLFGAAIFADSKTGTLFYDFRIDNSFVSGRSPVSLGASSAPANVAAAPDGSVWYADPGRNEIGHLTLDGTGTEVITHYPVPTAASYPYGIAFGPDGAVWFTENTGQKIGRLRVHPPGDVNASGTVDVADVFYLINFLFAGGPAPY